MSDIRTPQGMRKDFKKSTFYSNMKHFKDSVILNNKLIGYSIYNKV